MPPAGRGDGRGQAGAEARRAAKDDLSGSRKSSRISLILLPIAAYDLFAAV